MHHYPYGFQKWRSSTPSTVSQSNVQSGKIGNENQLNQQNRGVEQQQDANKKLQSAYAKVIQNNIVYEISKYNFLLSMSMFNVLVNYKFSV